MPLEVQVLLTVAYGAPSEVAALLPPLRAEADKLTQAALALDAMARVLAPLSRFRSADAVIAFRRRHALTQTMFWGVAGIPQERGSSYELGRPAPLAFQLALTAAFAGARQAGKLLAQLRDDGPWPVQIVRQGPVRFATGPEVLRFRARAGIERTVFWARIGVDRMRAAVYEASGRPLPFAVTALLTVTFGSADAAADTVEDLRQAAAAVLQKPQRVSTWGRLPLSQDAVAW